MEPATSIVAKLIPFGSVISNIISFDFVVELSMGLWIVIRGASGSTVNCSLYSTEFPAMSVG
jgi:hypothetical protein